MRKLALPVDYGEFNYGTPYRYESYINNVTVKREDTLLQRYAI